MQGKPRPPPTNLHPGVIVLQSSMQTTHSPSGSHIRLIVSQGNCHCSIKDICLLVVCACGHVDIKRFVAFIWGSGGWEKTLKYNSLDPFMHEDLSLHLPLLAKCQSRAKTHVPLQGPLDFFPSGRIVFQVLHSKMCDQTSSPT